MPDLNNYWMLQTAVFVVIFLIAILLSWRRKEGGSDPMPKETSNELRGLAILGIVFAHITYGKFYGTDFLFPLGIWGGVAVNLFFFLSGFGLAASAIYHPKSIGSFFKKRVLKIYLPLWILLAILLVADALILQRFYPWSEVIGAFLGYYREANLFTSINSPLWFLTPLLFYYLLFPFIFRSKHPRWSVLAVFVVSWAAAFSFRLPVSLQIQEYYQSHWLAFPLGVLYAALIISPQATCSICIKNLKCLTYRWVLSAWSKSKDLCGTAKSLAKVIVRLKNLPNIWRYLALAILAGLAWQTAYHSGVGKGLVLEQAYALFTMACLLAFFILKKSRLALLQVIGAYSFEIYLIHWPLIGRYDLVYKILPPWLGTVVYIPLLLGLAYVFNRLVELIQKKIKV